MDSASTTPSAPAAPPAQAASTVAASTMAAAAQKAANADPLILAAALVWISVDLIGDGLLALRNLLASATSERTATPS